MRALHRSDTSVPSCLARYQSGRDHWGDLSRDKTHYAEVVACLHRMQGARCAYCECDLSRESQPPHVEHFEQRSRAPALTFEWTNLFRSCSHTTRCGKHKDEQAGSYPPAVLLKPDRDNPREYLEFNVDGEVGPRSGVISGGAARARETIRVFNLNERGLVNARKAFLARPRSTFDEARIAFPDDADLWAFLSEIAEEYRASAFSAAILDLLGVVP